MSLREIKIKSDKGALKQLILYGSGIAYVWSRGKNYVEIQRIKPLNAGQDISSNNFELFDYLGRALPVIKKSIDVWRAAQAIHIRYE